MYTFAHQVERAEHGMRSIGQERCLRTGEPSSIAPDWVDRALLIGTWVLVLLLSFASCFTVLRYVDWATGLQLARSVAAHGVLNGGMAVWSSGSIAWLAAALSRQRRKLFFPQLLGKDLAWCGVCCIVFRFSLNLA
jgi:hypothetical protein